VDFKDSNEEASFRNEVRGFIKQNLPATLAGPFEYEINDPAREAPLKDWRKRLASQGWIAPHWPKEYGGAGMTPGEQFIFNEEMANSRAPQVGGMGVQMIGPTLILYGTDEQKAEHLPRITSGDVQWCQGYSEPGSGSDLASLQTRAVRDGDDYVLNGQKIWSSGAHTAEWMFLLARTDPDAPKHRGISMFLADMRTPGISVRPIPNMAGLAGLNEVFFEDVRVPALNRVGEENRGWYIGATLLDFERSGIGAAIGARHTVLDLVAYAREQNLADTMRLELADRMVESEVARFLSYRIISMQKRGLIPNYEASVNKMYYSELQQRLARTGIRLTGSYGMLSDEQRTPMRARFTREYMTSIPATIAAGSSEIQRNVIATRGLGLPRS